MSVGGMIDQRKRKLTALARNVARNLQAGQISAIVRMIAASSIMDGDIIYG
jgi:hypothetical protein